MNKINFENVPSTNTPLSAENLNQMQTNMEEIGAVISATEPTTNEKVWFKKSKNLFNPANAVSGFTHDGTGGIQGGGVSTGYIEIEGGQDYYIYSAKTSGGNWGAWYDSSKNFISGFTLGGVLYGIVQSPNNAKYMSFTVSYENNNPDYATNVMIAQSSVRIDYEPYVEKAIYTKNTNGAFEEFYSEEKLQIYSTEERKIGKFYDGKTLYEKTIIINGNGTESIYHPLSIDNLSFAKVNYGKSYCGFDNNTFPVCRTRTSDQLETIIDSSGWLNIINVAGKDYTGWTFVVVVEYTKN